MKLENRVYEREYIYYLDNKVIELNYYIYGDNLFLSFSEYVYKNAYSISSVIGKLLGSDSFELIYKEVYTYDQERLTTALFCKTFRNNN